MMNRFADLRVNEEHTYRMPGSCGEVIQGMLGNVEVLVTLPLNLYNSLTIGRVRGDRFERLPVKMQLGMERILDLLQVEKTVLQTLLFVYQPEIPVGIGMSSSSADLALGCGGLAHYLGKPLTPGELARQMVQIEPTDSIIFPEVTVFAQADAKLIQPLAPYPELRVLVLGTGEKIETVAFRQSRGQIPDVTEAYTLLHRGLRENDLFLLGSAAALSAFRWQELLRKPGLEVIGQIAREAGCYGIQAAHSGSVAGILYDSQRVSVEKLCSRLHVSGVLNIYPDVWDLHTVPGGLEVKEEGRFHKIK